MKKTKSSSLAANIDLSSFNAPAAELPTPTVVGAAVQQLTQTETKSQPNEMVKVPAERNLRKRETVKGTILQSVMLEKDILKKAKMQALEDECSLSEVVNRALKQYIQ
jgi:hypothetical protein